MPEARVGRVLAASLHQAILEELPQRLEFYEHWLRSDGLRDGSIGQAPLLAVLGFLRTEGEAYARVTARAGRLAADWTVAALPSLRRGAIARLPRPLRARAALRVVAGLARTISSASRVSARVRGATARLDVACSFFCDVREQQAHPLCGFYAAATAATLTALGMPASARVERCRAVDASTCVIAVELAGAGAAAPPAIAA